MKKSDNFLEGTWISVRWERLNRYGSWSLEGLLLSKNEHWDFAPAQRTGDRYAGSVIRTDNVNGCTYEYVFSPVDEELQIAGGSESGGDALYRIAKHDDERIFLYPRDEPEYRLILHRILPGGPFDISPKRTE